MKKSPDLFWYRNNGITILVKADKFELNHPNKIVLGMNDKESFSVINGAQTISASSKFLYSLQAVLNMKEEVLSTKYKGEDDAKKDAKKKLEDEIKDLRQKLQDGSSVRGEVYGRQRGLDFSTNHW